LGGRGIGFQVRAERNAAVAYARTNVRNVASAQGTKIYAEYKADVVAVSTIAIRQT